MTIIVTFNPNLRVLGDKTYVSATPELRAASVGTEVVVLEPVSGLTGRAWVAEHDEADGSVILSVAWAELKVVQTRSHAANDSGDSNTSLPSTLVTSAA